MPGFTLIDSITKQPVGKLPITRKGFRILRFNEPNANKRPSGELVMQQISTLSLMRAAPPVLDLQLVPRI